MTPYEIVLALTGIEIESIVTIDLVVEVHARTSQRSATCPDCGNASHHVHSYYCRRPTDLPIGGRPARLRLRVKRFRCANADCPRLTFAEPLPGFLARYSRRSRRLAETLLRSPSPWAGRRAAD